jgi:monomeric isocitrate dehydrogenase
MKMTILLSLAAQKYFNNTKKKFIDYAKDISIETNTRLSTVTSNLNDLQQGYDTDISTKTSPLVNYHKKNFTTSDLAKAYGIWLKTYRSN